MNIDLSKKELELLEAVLFAEIIKERNKAHNCTQKSNYIDELEDLKHKIWLIKAGIK